LSILFSIFGLFEFNLYKTMKLIIKPLKKVNDEASNYYGMYKRFGFEVKSSYEKYAVMQFRLTKGNK